MMVRTTLGFEEVNTLIDYQDYINILSTLYCTLVLVTLLLIEQKFLMPSYNKNWL